MKTLKEFLHEHAEIERGRADEKTAIQREWISIKVAEGRKLKGHKIGLTSRAMQQSSQIDEPDYGALLDDMFFDDGADIPAARFIVPRVEVELAFILGKRLCGPDCSIFDVLNATDYVTPAIEIIDARIQQIDPDTKAPAAAEAPEAEAVRKGRGKGRR